jgi:hypothetical protein
MITYSNIQKFQNEDFGTYLQRAGVSHSFLKQQKGGALPTFETKTDNVQIGKLVDLILTGTVENEHYAHNLFPYCKEIASAINKRFDSLLRASEKQVAFTADMEYMGFKMQSKGILDLLIEPIDTVIDLKVTKTKAENDNLQKLIGFMGYANQLWHYSRLAKVSKAYIMIYSIPSKRTELIEINVSEPVNTFWADACLNFGKVC